MENQNSFAKVRLADSHLDFEVLLDSIPGNSWEGQGKEVVASWKSSQKYEENVFYTDSNGLEMQKRILNFRPTWNFTQTDLVSGNYYPINSAIAIRGNNT